LVRWRKSKVRLLETSGKKIVGGKRVETFDLGPHADFG
jgi:hypothetical protein